MEPASALTGFHLVCVGFTWIWLVVTIWPRLTWLEVVCASQSTWYLGCSGPLSTVTDTWTVPSPASWAEARGKKNSSGDSWSVWTDPNRERPETWCCTVKYGRQRRLQSRASSPRKRKHLAVAQGLAWNALGKRWAVNEERELTPRVYRRVYTHVHAAQKSLASAMQAGKHRFSIWCYLYFAQ